jgi:hypothetical protein
MDAMANGYDDKIRLYALADVSLFVEQSATIRRLVLQALQVAPDDRKRVTISPGSGWFEYTALDELWVRSAPPALPSQADALKAADGVLSRLEQACSDANPAWPEKLRGRALLPSVNLLRRAELCALLRADGSGFDHWLYRAQPQLALNGGSKTRAPVFGAQIEVRIGHMGQPISVRSRWTPLAAQQKFTDLSAYSPPPHAGDGTANGNQAQPLLAFLLEGEGIPQFYLAPYYFLVDDHGATAVSATPFSLTVDIERMKQDDETITIAALARGGSGDYIYKLGRIFPHRSRERTAPATRTGKCAGRP